MSLYGRLRVYLLVALMPFMFTACPQKSNNDFQNLLLLYLFSLINSPAPTSPTAYCVNGAGTKTMTVTWTASRSFDVSNAVSGGHKIYYSNATGVSKSTPNVVDVPNTTSTTTGTITGLYSGCTYYVKVGGYSALNPTGGNLSTESTIAVP